MTNVFDGNVFTLQIESNSHGNWVCLRKKPFGLQNLIKVDHTLFINTSMDYS